MIWDLEASYYTYIGCRDFCLPIHMYISKIPVADLSRYFQNKQAQ